MLHGHISRFLSSGIILSGGFAFKFSVYSYHTTVSVIITLLIAHACDVINTRQLALLSHACDGFHFFLSFTSPFRIFVILHFGY